MGFLLNIMAAGALFGAGYYVGMKRCENGQENRRGAAIQSSERVSGGISREASGGAVYDRGIKGLYQESCSGPDVAKYLLNRTAEGAAKLKKGIDELVQ